MLLFYSFLRATMSSMHPLGEYANEYELKDGKPRVCKVESELGFSPTVVRDTIRESIHARAHLMEAELERAFEAIRRYPKSVTILGSARLDENNLYYQKARHISQKICGLGFAVITGGGPGIMEASNKGSMEECGYGVGFNIELSREQNVNKFVTHGINFKHFSTRKVALFFSAEAYLFFPGGFGTLDEFFSVLTMVQTKKIPRIPMICVGSDFWQPLNVFIRGALLQEFGTISPEDVNLYQIEDDVDKIIEIVKKAPLRTEFQV